MDLDAIDTGLLHTHGSVAKLMRKLVNLIDRDGARCLAGIRRAHKRTEQSGAACREC